MEQMGEGQPDRRYISASHPAESLHLQEKLCANFKHTRLVIDAQKNYHLYNS